MRLIVEPICGYIKKRLSIYTAKSNHNIMTLPYHHHMTSYVHQSMLYVTMDP